MPPQIHVFLGTKAEYIKTAPLLRLMQADGIPYRLIDSGQHARFVKPLRSELGVKEPDVVVVDGEDVASIPHAISWALRVARLMVSRKRLRRELFDDLDGICVVHGDTPTTLLATMLARRAALRVAHLEAGLRSHKLFHPFPEEIIRILVMRRADLLFTPDPVSEANLQEMGVKGTIVPLGANTVVDAVAHTGVAPGHGGGGVVATMHRVENLQSPDRTEGFVQLLMRVARDHPVLFAMHPPTILTLNKGDAVERLTAAGVNVTPLMPYGEFLKTIANADFVVTDGGSIQEESTFFGVPALLWRDRSERPDGIGESVVVSRYDPTVVDDFLANHQAHRRPPQPRDRTPSRIALEALLNA